MTKIISLITFSICIASICSQLAESAQVDEVEERLTPSKRGKLEEFRKDVAHLLEDDYERSDEYLLGYLQSKRWKLFSAKQMLKIAKSWKKSHNIEELAKSNFSSEMLERFPVRLEGFDKKGCPLLEFDFGKWDLAGYILNQEFVRDGVINIVKHYWQILAKLEDRNRNSFPNCHQTRTITFLEIYNASHTSEVNSINACVQIINAYVNYFPNSVFEIYLIDVPHSFMPILELFETSVSDEIYGIVKIFKRGTKDWRQDLDAIIDVDQRSRLSGGTA